MPTPKQDLHPLYCRDCGGFVRTGEGWESVEHADPRACILALQEALSILAQRFDAHLAALEGAPDA